MQGLSSLPPEILREILILLPIQSLLRFGETSRYNHAMQEMSLSKLRFGVFPTRLDGLLSLAETLEDQHTTCIVQKTLEKRKARSKEAIIFNQNLAVARILHRYSRSLRELEISLWDLQLPAVETLAKLGGLQRLSIRLDHPSSKCTDLHPSFWCQSPGSTIWNNLYAKKSDPRVFGRLRSLNLERAGLTDYQLLQILNGNPKITEIRLKKCLTLTDEFFRGLSNSKLGKQIRLLHFTQSDNLRVDNRILGYISQLISLTSLSFSGCVNISNAKVRELNDEHWGIKEIEFPHVEQSSISIEIDPAYT